jgi:ribose transport system substrate-binding protein
MSRASWFSLAITVCLASCGCGGGTGQPKAKYRIAVIPKGLTHEFWQSVDRGAKQAALDLTDQGTPTEELWDGPRTEDDAKNQNDIIKVNLSKNVNGIVLAPQHSETMVAPVEAAVKQNTPVVVIDSGLANEEVIVKYIATNNYHGGQLAAENLLRLLREDGKTGPKLVLLRYQTGSESTDRREQGFIDVVEAEIKKQVHAGVPEESRIRWLSKDKFSGATKNSAMETAGPLINSLRDQGIDGIFAPNESSAAGMLQVLRNQKLNKKVRFVGFDSSDELLQGLEEGDIDGLVIQDPYRMGYLGVWTLVQYLEGYDVAEPMTPEHPNGKYLSTGESFLTKANRSERELREKIEPELQKQRRIQPMPFAKKRSRS